MISRESKLDIESLEEFKLDNENLRDIAWAANQTIEFARTIRFYGSTKNVIDMMDVVSREVFIERLLPKLFSAENYANKTIEFAISLLNFVKQFDPQACHQKIAIEDFILLINKIFADEAHLKLLKEVEEKTQEKISAKNFSYYANLQIIDMDALINVPRYYEYFNLHDKGVSLDKNNYTDIHIAFLVLELLAGVTAKNVETIFKSKYSLEIANCLLKPYESIGSKATLYKNNDFIKTVQEIIDSLPASKRKEAQDNFNCRRKLISQQAPKSSLFCCLFRKKQNAVVPVASSPRIAFEK